MNDKITRSVLTQKRLKELFSYSHETGIFIRKINTGGQIAGSVAGYIMGNGYMNVRIDGKLYLLQRIAWLYVNGHFPEHGVDHRNGNVKDNSILNLRHATQSCNMQNQKINIRNTSGIPGVSFHRKNSNWTASIKINQKQIYIGSFPSKIEAALARLTHEINNPNWTCNFRSKLVGSIIDIWPTFNSKHLSIICNQ